MIYEKMNRSASKYKSKTGDLQEMLLVVMCVWLITIPPAPLLNLPCFPSTQNISICQISSTR